MPVLDNLQIEINLLQNNVKNIQRYDMSSTLTSQHLMYCRQDSGVTRDVSIELLQSEAKKWMMIF